MSADGLGIQAALCSFSFDLLLFLKYVVRLCVGITSIVCGKILITYCTCSLLLSPNLSVSSNYINLYCVQGDILFLHMSKDPIRTGEIVVFHIDVSIC